MPERICQHCQKQFGVTPSRAAEGKGKFCSRECRIEWVRADRTIPIEQRFWAKVDKDGPIPEHRPDLGPCWIWTGSIPKGRYGTIEKDGLTLYAHAVSYEWAKGSIPPDHEIDHLCRNRSCVNPEHLEAVPRRVNWLRGESASAIATRDGVCQRGHPFTPENTYYRTNGHRMCRACGRLRHRSYDHRNKDGLDVETEMRLLRGRLAELEQSVYYVLRELAQLRGKRS